MLLDFDYMQKVDLQDYQIWVGSVGEGLSEFLRTHRYSRIFVLMDENTASFCFPLLPAEVLSEAVPIRIQSGEIHKNIETCQEIWSALMQAGADRNALLINLGGGVIGDMGGFCASTYKRGIDFVQVPTTLLSQVDASIGGKLGIDFQQIKNSIGVFANPRAVFVDTRFLYSLSARERRSGFAEIIKHALIVDKSQWVLLKGRADLYDVPVEELIVASLRIKKAVVEEDPFERGLRKALNFGHTIGHAIESLALEGSNPLLHGEAIAVGMLCESFLSWKKGFLGEEALEEISDQLISWYQPHPLSEAAFADAVNLMRNDKKNQSGGINFSLIGPPGTVHINQYFSVEEIEESLRYLHTKVEPFQK